MRPCVVMASHGYPEAYEAASRLPALEQAAQGPEAVVFRRNRPPQWQLVTSGAVSRRTALGPNSARHSTCVPDVR
jgi:hypothetical protein